MEPTARYPTPPFKQLGDFFSLREADLKGGCGLIGRDAAKIARFTIFKRATSHAALFLLIRCTHVRYTFMRYTPHEIHAREIHAHEVHAHKEHASEVHAYEIQMTPIRCTPMKVFART